MPLKISNSKKPVARVAQAGDDEAVAIEFLVNGRCENGQPG